MHPTGPVLMITRPEPAGAAFALEVIEALGRPVQTVLSPVIGIVPLQVNRPAVLPAGLVLTSAHGAAAAARMALPSGLPAWCVGGRTAEMATAAGLSARSAKGDAAALVQMILSHGPTGPLLHLRGAHVTGDIAARLTVGGVPCTDLVCYRQEALPLTAQARACLAQPSEIVLPLFSPRSVSIMAQNGPFSARITVIAISRAVADAAQALAPAAIVLAARPDAGAVRDATCAAIAANSMSSGA